MAKNSIRDYSATNSSNTDIQSIDISEGCSPAGINNAIREVMADLKDVSTGTIALESPAFDSASLTGDLTFGDNDSAVFGAGNDLTINHDGSNSFITDSGTGSLYIQGTSGVFIRSADGGENFAGFTDDGAVTLYHDNAAKLATTATGVDVTGTVTADGLTVEADGTHIYLKQTNGDFGHQFRQINDGGALQIGRNVSGTFTEAMRITSAGKIGIGTSSISSTLEIVPPDTSAIIETHSFNTSAQNHMQMRNNSGTEVGSIYVTTTSTSYFTSSDYRLKTAVNYDWDATTRLKQLRPARFEWIVDGDDAVPVDGFLAHEVQDVVPEAISGTKDAMRDEEYEVTPAVLDEDGNEVTPAVMGTRSVPDYQGIDQSKLVPLLVKTILELEARITALETA
jgi:hypothetical protein